MTKSRTLRKAGAVVLSLAMAFSVAGVAPSADAAAKKPALSAKKGTITVGKKKAVKVKNTTAKKVKKLVVSSNKKAVATVKKNSKVKFTVTGKKAGTAKITAKVTLKKAVAKKKVYKLKYTATVKKAAATPTPAVTDAPEVSVKLSYSDTIQADGTYLTGGAFTLSYGSALGTPQTITYYKDEEVVSVKTSDGGSLTEGLKYPETGTVSAKGKYYAVIKNTVGKEYTSNAITLTDAEAAAVIKDFAIIDDYDKTVDDVKNGSNLSFSATDDKAVIKVTLNRAYAGKFLVFEGTDDKITGNIKSSRTVEKTAAEADNATAATHNTIKAAKNFTATQALVATTGSIRFVNEDGSVTYMFQTTASGITRGKSYSIVFDQDAENITDDVAATVEKNGTLNVFATAAVAPYITAPATVTLDNPVATNPAYKVTLKNANGDAYEQINSKTNTANTTSKVTVYTSAKKAVGNTTGINTDLGGYDYVKGVATIAGSAAVSGIKYYAEWVGEKGIYGEAEVKVASSEVDVKTAAAASITAASADDADVTVNVTLAGVQTAGKVYITSNLAKFDATKADTYDSVSAAVAKDATSVKITSAVKKATAGAERYYAIFVPDDTEKYGKVESAGFQVSAVVSSYSMSELAEVPVDTATNAVLTAKDQFGNNIAVDQPTVDMIPVDEKDSTIIGAAANVDNKAKQSSSAGFVITAGSAGDLGKFTITAESTGTAPAANEVWVGQLVTNATAKTKSYLVAKCDSAGASYNASTWTLSIVQATGAASEIVPESAARVPVGIVDAAGNKVEKFTATSETNSKVIKLWADYYLVDQFGNKLSKASDDESVASAIKTGPDAGGALKFSWNTAGKITKIAYATETAASGTDVTDASKTYGAEITITVAATAAYTAAKAEYEGLTIEKVSDYEQADSVSEVDTVTAIKNKLEVTYTGWTATVTKTAFTAPVDQSTDGSITYTYTLTKDGYTSPSSSSFTTTLRHT